MPEPGSEADEAVRDARDVLWEAIGRYTVRDTVVGELLDAYEAAIRDEERAKVEALVRAAEAFLARTTLIGRCLNCWESGWAHRDGCEAGALESALDAVRAGSAS